jgi:hypothetical protein
MHAYTIILTVMLLRNVLLQYHTLNAFPDRDNCKG